MAWETQIRKKQWPNVYRASLTDDPSDQQDWRSACVQGGALSARLHRLAEPPAAAIAQLAARRSHNPKVVSSILTRRNCFTALFT